MKAIKIGFSQNLFFFSTHVHVQTHFKKKKGFLWVVGKQKITSDFF